MNLFKVRFFQHFQHSDDLARREKVEELCRELGQTKPEETHQVFERLHNMVLQYYDTAMKEAKNSFRAALGIAIAGTVFIVYGIVPSNRVG